MCIRKVPENLEKSEGAPEMSDQPNYTCNDYRLEMILLSLKRRLSSENLSDAEKLSILDEIRRIETQMGMA